jgi:probable F420-dependent oxidoreductase
VVVIGRFVEHRFEAIANTVVTLCTLDISTEVGRRRSQSTREVRAEVSTATFQMAIGSPVVTRSGARWADEGSIEDLARIAEAADRLGYHHLTCSEHIALPSSELDRRGAIYWDPLATFGYLAARTEHIRFATSVVVLAYHHPLEIAKRYGTLDKVSNGRVILGVGVGTLKEEFDLIGAPFDDRGPRADDALKALRASLSRRLPEYHGPFYDFEGLVVDPCAVQDHLPIWVGGRTLRSLRRAINLADGWAPFAVSPSQAADWLRQVDVPSGFEIVLPPTERLDPVNEPSKTQEVLGQTAALGATIIMTGFASTTLEGYVEQVEALAALRKGL